MTPVSQSLESPVNPGWFNCTFGSAVDISDCSFESNIALGANGGGVSLRNAYLTVSDVAFTRNIARIGQGGGVYVTTEASARWALFLRRWGFRQRGGSKIVIEDASFDNNFARNGGGGIATIAPPPPAYAITVSISACEINNNRVQNAGYGGGIYADNVSITLADNNFDWNQVFLPGANSRGGAVAGIACPSFSMTGGTVAHNRANYGGGLALKDCANPTVTGITFNLNFVTMPPGTGEGVITESGV